MGVGCLFLLLSSWFRIYHDKSRLKEFARRAQERREQEHRAISGPEGCEGGCARIGHQGSMAPLFVSAQYS